MRVKAKISCFELELTRPAVVDKYGKNVSPVTCLKQSLLGKSMAFGLPLLKWWPRKRLRIPDIPIFPTNLRILTNYSEHILWPFSIT